MTTELIYTKVAGIITDDAKLFNLRALQMADSDDMDMTRHCCSFDEVYGWLPDEDDVVCTPKEKELYRLLKQATDAGGDYLEVIFTGDENALYDLDDAA